MSCTRTAEALDALQADDLDHLAPALAEHIGGCTDCARALAGAQLDDLALGEPAAADDDVVLAALGLGEMPASVDPLGREFLAALVEAPAGTIPASPSAEAAPDLDVDLPVPGGPAPLADRPSALSRPMAMIPPEEMLDPPPMVPVAAVAVPRPRRSWGGWLAGAGALAAALLAFVLIKPMLSGPDDTPAIPSAAVQAPAKVSIEGAKDARNEAAAEKAAAEKAAAEKAAADAGSLAGDAAAAEDTTADAAVAAASKSSRRARTRRARYKPAAAPKPAAPKPAARRPAARKPAPKKESTSEVDDLLGALDGSGGGSKSRAASPAAATPAPSGDPMLPEKLTRRQILTVVKRNARSVTTCKDGTDASGTVPVELVINREGRVTSAKVKSGPQRGTPVGSCIERKVRAFRFPQFSGDPMRIVMPFAL